jgi:hypothetical protein
MFPNLPVAWKISAIDLYCMSRFIGGQSMHVPTVHRGIQPARTNKPTTIAAPVPAVHWPGRQNPVQNRSARAASVITHGPVAGRAVRSPAAFAPTVPAAKHPNSMLQPGPAQPPVAQRAVIQGWMCRECGHNIRDSYDHSTRCSQYYYRVYETQSDRDANRYDRRHGENRTRSGSFDRQRSSGVDERMHFHENLYGPGGFQERMIGYTSPGGRNCQFQ